MKESLRKGYQDSRHYDSRRHDNRRHDNRQDRDSSPCPYQQDAKEWNDLAESWMNRAFCALNQFDGWVEPQKETHEEYQVVFDKALKDIIAKKAKAQEETESLQAKLNSLTEVHEESQQAVKNLQARLEGAKMAHEQTKREMTAKLGTANQGRTTLEQQAKSETAKLRAELTKAQQALKTTQNQKEMDKKEHQGKLTEAENKYKDMHSDYVAKAAEWGREKVKLQSQLFDANHAQREAETALASALDENSNFQSTVFTIAESEAQQHKQNIKHLEQQARGRIAAETEHLRKQLAEAIKIRDEALAESDKMKQELDAAKVTVDEDRIQSREYYFTTSRENAELSCKIRDLNCQLDECRAQVEHSEARRDELNRQLMNLRASRAVVKEEAADSDDETEEATETPPMCTNPILNSGCQFLGDICTYFMANPGKLIWVAMIWWFIVFTN